MNRFDELLAFVQVVESGSITKAAERLGLVKSAVSRRINDLEDRLKARLIVRSTSGMSLTEIGRAFYERAARIVADVDEAELTVTDASAALSGTIKMAAPVTLTTMHLMPLINAFLQQHQDLSIDLSVSDRIVDLVSEGFDLTVRSGVLADSSLIARKLVDMERVTCASPEYLRRFGVPASPQDLDSHTGVVSTNAPESSYWLYESADGQTHLSRPSVKLSVNNGECAIAAAAAGLGICAVPMFISSAAIARGDVIPILTDFQLVRGGIFAVYPPGRHLAHRVRTLIDFLVAGLQREPLCNAFKLPTSGRPSAVA